MTRKLPTPPPPGAIKQTPPPAPPRADHSETEVRYLAEVAARQFLRHSNPSRLCAAAVMEGA